MRLVIVRIQLARGHDHSYGCHAQSSGVCQMTIARARLSEMMPVSNPLSGCLCRHLQFPHPMRPLFH